MLKHAVESQCFMSQTGTAAFGFSPSSAFCTIGRCGALTISKTPCSGSRKRRSLNFQIAEMGKSLFALLLLKSKIRYEINSACFGRKLGSGDSRARGSN